MCVIHTLKWLKFDFNVSLTVHVTLADLKQFQRVSQLHHERLSIFCSVKVWLGHNLNQWTAYKTNTHRYF